MKSTETFIRLKHLGIRIFFLFSFLLLILPGNLFSQTYIKIGIKEHPTDPDKMAVYSKVTGGTFTDYPLDSIQFAVKWPMNTVDITGYAAGIYGFQDMGLFNDGVNYYRKFATSSPGDVTWPQDQENLLMTFDYAQSGTGCSGTFEIANDTWAVNNNAKFETWVFGSIYGYLGIYNASAGDLSPIDISDISKTNLECYGVSSGTISVTATAPTALTYSSDGGTNYYSNGGYFQNLAAGDHNIIVKDNNGCTKSGGTVSLTQPDEIVISSQQAFAVTTCYGGDNGEILISASGGTGSLYYSIDNGGNFQKDDGAFNGLTAGTYPVLLKDDNGCTKPGNTLEITQPEQVTINDVSKTDLICNGDNSGTITIDAEGGTGTLKYSIQDPAAYYTNGGSFASLAAGTYFVRVKDENDCSASYGEVTLDEPTAVTISNQTKKDLTCYGVNTGEITITATGGTGTLLYSVDGGSTYKDNSGDFDGLAPGSNYTVKVKDQNNCVETGNTLNISQPTEIIIAKQNAIDITCNGQNDGQIQLDASGGTGTLYYSINNGSDYSTTKTFTGLGPGTSYTVKIKDDNNCTKIGNTLEITDPPAINITSENAIDITCNGANDGQILIDATGGTGTLSYSIDNGTTWYQNSGDFGGLSSASNYSVQVKDVNGCQTAGSTHEITEPDAITLSESHTDNICNGGSDGKIVLTAGGGNGSFEYSKNGGASYQSSNSFDKLPAGTYNMQAKDYIGCTKSIQVEITEPEPIQITETHEDVECGGDATGSVTIFASRDSETFEYSLEGTEFTESNEFENVRAGNYVALVRDDDGCLAQINIVIEQPPPLLLAVDEKTNIEKCYGDATGQITVTPSGGTPPLSYSLDGGSFEGSTSWTGLEGGIHTVEVQDDIGCSYTLNVTLSQPDEITTDMIVSDIKCNGEENGSINLVVTGGTTPYTFQWKNRFEGTEDLSGLPAGTYQVTVTDKNNCKVTDSATIQEPSRIQMTYDTTHISCYEANDGAISTEISGGTPPYSVRWNNGQHDKDINNLIPGNYEITVKDLNLCEVKDTILISEPPLLTVSLKKQNVSYYGESDGRALSSVTGGTPPYNYFWTPGSYTTANITNVPADNYKLVVTDNNGCTASATTKIVASETDVSIPTAFTPNGDGWNDVWKVRSISKYPEAHLMIFNVRGDLLYEDEGIIEPWDGKDNAGNELPGKSTYYYVLTLNDHSAPITGTILLIR